MAEDEPNPSGLRSLRSVVEARLAPFGRSLDVTPTEGVSEHLPTEKPLIAR
jgi:hypothetical protein